MNQFSSAKQALIDRFSSFGSDVPSPHCSSRTALARCHVQTYFVYADYDGGDCCQCTCNAPDSDDDWRCSDDATYACIDPAAPCVEDDDITAEMVEHCGYPGSIGNGWCDQHNNKPECGECACVSGKTD